MVQRVAVRRIEEGSGKGSSLTSGEWVILYKNIILSLVQYRNKMPSLLLAKGR